MNALLAKNLKVKNLITWSWTTRSSAISFEFWLCFSNTQKQSPRGALGKGVLKTCKSNFIEITLRHGCSPVNLPHIFRAAFVKKTSERLLLNTGVDYAGPLYANDIYWKTITVKKLHMFVYLFEWLQETLILNWWIPMI